MRPFPRFFDQVAFQAVGRMSQRRPICPNGRHSRPHRVSSSYLPTTRHGPVGAVGQDRAGNDSVSKLGT